MNEIELQQEIRRLHEENKEQIKVLEDDFFYEQAEYAYLKKAFRASKYYQRHWKWHQLVRIVLEPASIAQYMYDRLLNLILKHRRSFDDYFELKTEDETFQIPNPLADLNRLEILCYQYYDIYSNIKDQIHFDYLKSEYLGPNIKGKINWQKTINTSTTEFPIIFKTALRETQFITPENILLVLCAEWMYRESLRLLQIEYTEPLSKHNQALLADIVDRTKDILLHFPFTDVLNASKRYWGLSYYDPRILELEKEVKLRLNQGLVRNLHYAKLPRWLEEFRQLDIPRVSANTPTKHILEAIENIDTVYEAWIFMEFVDFLYQKGLLVDFRLRDKPFCSFEYRGRVVTLWYEKVFNPAGSNAWALEHKPDFTAMLGEDILAVFDAKNYAKSSSITEPQNKMLAYLNNLDANFGALIFPNHPEYWDDVSREKRTDMVVEFLQAQDTKMLPNEIRKKAKEISSKAWDELDPALQNLLPPKHMQTIMRPPASAKARYHIDQTLCLIRMSPTTSEHSLSMKEDSLNSIFEAIVSRLPS